MDQGFGYNVDMAICIDGTGSMEPIIEATKDRALRLYSDITDGLAEQQKTIRELRVRVIVFRDVRCDSDSIETSPFFVLPDQSEDFSRYVDAIDAHGGMGRGASGLHAFATAVGSDWTAGGDRQRHIVVIWTDTYTHSLEDGTYPPGAGLGLANTLDDLYDLWEVGQDSSRLKPNARRLLVFAPDDDSWNPLEQWSQAIHIPSEAGEGLGEMEFDYVVNVIANSV